MKKSNEYGRSMIEMLGVLAIIAMLSAGALSGYSKAMRRHRLNEMISQTAQMVVNIRSFYGNQDSYETLDENTAVQYNIVTQRMIGENSTLYSPYHGRINFSLDAAVEGGPDKTAFVITYRDLPVEACIGMARTDWGHGEKYGFLGLSVGADDADPSYPLPPTSYFTTNKQMAPLTMQEAIEHCAGTTPNASRSTVALKFF